MKKIVLVLILAFITITAWADYQRVAIFNGSRQNVEKQVNDFLIKHPQSDIISISFSSCTLTAFSVDYSALIHYATKECDL